MSIDAGACSFCYAVEDGVVALLLVDKAYPRKLAFAYLADALRLFREEAERDSGPAWKDALATVGRAYAYLKFDRALLKLKREYADPGTKSNAGRLAEELSDIQSIMRKNIGEVLDRGEKLEEVARVSARLVEESKEFKWGAKKLNMLHAWRTYAPLAVVGVVVSGALWWRFFL